MRFLGIVALLLGLSLGARADSLDVVALPVDGRGETERQEALQQGLKNMLVRLSGKQQVLDQPVTEQALAQLDRWVTRYDYNGDTLLARYDTRGLMDFMAAKGAPVWGFPRPQVLIWLVEQGAGRGEMVAGEHALREQLVSEAQRRGLSLVVPQWDSQDRNAITVADIRGRFDSQLLSASDRYPHELVVASVLYQGSPTKVSWRVLQGKKILDQGREETASAEQAVKTLVDAVTDQLAQRYAVASSASQQLTLLEVEQVQTLADWHQLQGFLTGLSGMRAVSLVQTSDQVVTFGLDFGASDSQLRSLLELSRQLRPCPDDAVAGPQWRYCWRS
ncbi:MULTISPECIES: DUF2066 domain-containing protein [Alcanivorax]|uniref:DUF2066 domain-containing protein n=1 Tax=Alcanivorax TaxID=59753 RepID=UPI0025BA80E0|nr:MULTISPECIES: DUF2066 domain-containing protein [Alcanivorax]